MFPTNWKRFMRCSVVRALILLYARFLELYFDSAPEVEIICDDEGLFKEPQKISAINNLGQVQLVGSILIVGPADSEGNLTSLSNKDANYILDRIQLLETRNFKNPYPILTQCEYA